VPKRKPPTREGLFFAARCTLLCFGSTQGRFGSRTIFGALSGPLVRMGRFFPLAPRRPLFALAPVVPLSRPCCTFSAKRGAGPLGEGARLLSSDWAFRRRASPLVYCGRSRWPPGVESLLAPAGARSPTLTICSPTSTSFNLLLLYSDRVPIDPVGSLVGLSDPPISVALYHT